MVSFSALTVGEVTGKATQPIKH